MKLDYDIATLVNRFKDKDRIALSKLISIVENQPEKSYEIFEHFKDNKNQAYIIGITGSPGVGKSTLTGVLSQKLLEQGKSVGIICVDPTSPFSGGAFLGDRVRMNTISLNENVFLRSLASRGYKGGISKAVFDISLLYEAFGKDVIIIETVGAGQAEFDIYNLAYTVIVVLVPGYGDSIQMQKAGIIEIGDIYDVNKKDLGGEDIAVQLETMLDDGNYPSGWRPPVSMTDACACEGVDDLLQNIWDHKEHIELSGQLEEKKRNRYSYKIHELIHSKIEALITERFIDEEKINKIIDDALKNGKFSVYDSIQKIFDSIKILDRV